MCSVRYGVCVCVHLVSNSKLKWIYKKPQKPSLQTKSGGGSSEYEWQKEENEKKT